MKNMKKKTFRNGGERSNEPSSTALVVPVQVLGHIVLRNFVCSPPWSRPHCWSANQTVTYKKCH